KGLDDATAAKLAKSMTTFFGDGFLQAAEIRKHKSTVDSPLLCEPDGPGYQLRRGYEQVSVDVADVTEKMTQRYVLEVDTTKANEAWEAEVAEDLRRKREAEAAEADSAAAEAGV